MKRHWKWIAGAGLVLAPLVAIALFPLSSPPSQPINFSHRKHAGDYAIPCQYCHLDARRSPFAGIPSAERCLGCHRIVAADRPEIVKLKGYLERGEPIPWQRIYRLPDFTYFNHAPHLKAKLDCSECHGHVDGMDNFREIPTLEMGWCLNCHREKGAPVDCAVCHR